MIKSRRMRWERHVERKERNVYTVSVGKPEGNRPLEKPGSGYGQGDETSDSIKNGKFLTYLGSYYIVKRDHALWG
jgi:hypothetical protein